MSNEPKSFWGKFSVITAFLTALIGLVTVFSQCSSGDRYTPHPTREFEDTVQPKETRSRSPEMGNYCYDFNGNRRCRLDAPAPIGSPCFCRGQGTGVVGY